MKDFDSTLNEDWSVSVEYMGRDRNPVVIIDDALKAPQRAVDWAAEQGSFVPVPESENFYPGTRAKVPGAHGANLYARLANLLTEIFAPPEKQPPHFGACAFSIVTRPPDQLTRLQCVPHFDTTHPTQLVSVHFLCDPAMGGTSFYRHRGTGLERITDELIDDYMAIVEAELKNSSVSGYPNGDNELFERVGSVDAKFNRLVLFCSYILHAGDIPATMSFSADPRVGRLTLNTFIRL